MKQLIICILTVCLGTATTSAQHACSLLSRYTQLPKNGVESAADTTGYDVTHYHISIAADPSADSFQGTVEAYFTATRNIQIVTIDAADNLQIDSVKYNSTVITDFSHSEGKLSFYLPAQLTAGNTGVVTASYHSTASASKAYTQTATTYGVPIIYTQSEAFAASTWWVCKNTLTDKADSITVEIIHPAQYRAVANGLLISETETENGQTKTVWKHRYPVPPYLVGIAVSKYMVYTNYVETANGTMPIVNYIYPQEYETSQWSLDRVPQFITFLASKYGDYPYSLEKYGNIQWEWGGGMEHSTGSFVIYFQEGLLVHELMHQWFGDKVTCATWHDIWLNEGFATYSEGLWKEYRYGEKEFESWKNLSILISTLSDGGSVYNPEAENEGRIFDSRLSYYKASMVIHQLRMLLGDEVFFPAMQSYLNDARYAYDFANTEDLKAILESCSGKDLAEFFNDWIYGEGFPVFDIDVTQDADNKIHISVNQTTSHASVDLFETPFEILFANNENTRSETRTFYLSTNRQQFEISDIDFKVVRLEFEPHYNIIAKKGKLTLNSLEVGENFYKPFDIYPNPTDSYLTVSAQSRIRQLQLFSISGNLMSSIQNVNATSCNLQMETLPQGAYLLQTSLEDGSIHKDRVLKR